MDYLVEYEKWLNRADDETVVGELKALKGKNDALESSFSGELSFGTAGLRGILGAGTNRMNVYTVRRATQGLAIYINECYGGGSVSIAYDSRNMSLDFAQEAAAVLAANDISVFIYDRLMPTPMLSYAVRENKSKAGIMITASHNPAEYNGFKVYGADGCQMTVEDADAVYMRIQKVDIFDDVKHMSFTDALDSGLVKYIGKRTVEQYYTAVKEQSIYKDICQRYPLKVVYSPLNGTGNEPVRRILRDMGNTEVSVVPEQEMPDGNFPTCKYPNPETREALSLGLELCAEKRPDIFIATDPDADRIGVAFKDGDDYRILTGNEIGALLLNYIITARTDTKTMPERPIAVKSIVSTDLATQIAKDAGVEMRNVLTGFKFIGEQLLLLEQKGEEKRFIFGFEESCGYLCGSYVRDKDAVLAAELLCEMTSYYMSKKRTVISVLEGLYDKYGFYIHSVDNIAFMGLDGTKKMQDVMKRFYESYPTKVCDFEVVTVKDYKTRTAKHLLTGAGEPIELPEADVVELLLENNSKIIVRPSGTEPKMKIYITTCEKTRDDSLELAKRLSEEIRRFAQIT
ncbi:MAG: phospho-sugar mutase [Oscillospiraceae bacterium]